MRMSAAHLRSGPRREVNVDRKADALYLRFDNPVIVESELVFQGVMHDYDESNEVAGVEILNLTKHSAALKRCAL